MELSSLNEWAIDKETTLKWVVNLWKGTPLNERVIKNIYLELGEG